MEAEGLDSEGQRFRNASELWREALGSTAEEGGGDDSGGKRQEWYRKGIAYWQGVEASVDGVLGGYGHVDDADVKGSEAFLKPLLAERFGAGKRHLVALDCGSGIGRVSKNLLLRHFKEVHGDANNKIDDICCNLFKNYNFLVDLVEPVSHFLEAARENLAPENYITEDAHKAANFYCVPLQEFTPETGRYDVIWVQWCIGHLPDDDFVAFFKRAKAGLKPNGFFVLKENIARNGFVLDKEDQSITRSDAYFKQLFQRCGLHLYKTKDQKGLPDELFAVKMYALVTDRVKANGGRSKAKMRMPAVIKS